MQMTFRWFGQSDSIPLRHVRQIPAVVGVVSALYDVAPGEIWPAPDVDRLASTIDEAGLRFAVVESIPVHEDIKLGRPARERLIDNYCASVESVAAAGITTVCYNFMPVFDWMRTDLAMSLPDGSTALAFDEAALAEIKLAIGASDLPGWSTRYDAAALASLRNAYSDISEDALWEHLEYFLLRVAPVAESAGVKLAIHPDDPPWPILGLPRIVTSGAALERIVRMVDTPANGVTFCTGSLAPDPANDLPAMARRLGDLRRIHFVHCRNIKRTGARSFHETAHPSSLGDVDMFEVMRALHQRGFAGPMRPDHGRMIWDERGRPGYGLYDRALGATYLQGLWEGVSRSESSGANAV